MAYAPTVPVAPKARTAPLVKLETYTKTTLPAASLNQGVLIQSTNGGGSDAPCLAISDGIGWFLIAVGAELA